MSTLFLASYAETTNIARTGTPTVTASFTSDWNNLGAINNGTTFLGYYIEKNLELWGCYIGKADNQATQWLQYQWSELQRISAVAVYFSWAISSGEGVVMPEGWSIQYSNDGSDWHDAVLLANETYTTYDSKVNSVNIKEVEATYLRMTINAASYDDNGTTRYSAITVNEWEVYGEPVNTTSDVTNIAPLATINGDEAYTPDWNKISSINNGAKGFGLDQDGNSTWANWTASHNLETQKLRYIWSEKYEISSVSVYFTSADETGTDGGVYMPASWSLEYLDNSNNWVAVELSEGQSYTLYRSAVNSVEFTPIRTTSMKLVLHAAAYSGGYNAMGVNEWEVYGEAVGDKPEPVPASAEMKVSGTAHWGTFVAPFRIAVSELPAGIEAYNVTYDGTKIVNTKIADDTDIPANLPVLLCNTIGEDVAHNYDGYVSTEVFPHDNNLVGTTTALASVPQSVERDAQTYNTYLLQYKSGVIGWYKVAQDGLSLIANRAYLVVPATVGEAKDFIAIEDMPTGIEAAPGQVQEFKGSRDQVYNLAGQRIANGQQPTANSLPKGVYIINGRKEIRK